MRSVGLLIMACVLGLNVSTAWAENGTATSGKAAASQQENKSSAAKASGDKIQKEEKAMTPAEKEKAAKAALKRMEHTAELQLKALFEESIKRPVKELSKDGRAMPSAAMMFVKGGVKEVDIKQKDVPAGARVEIYRAALRAAARHHTIIAAVIYYTAAAPEKDGKKQTVLVAEYEHVLGVSAMRIIPYDFKNGKLSFGKPVDRPKPFVMFYDQKQASQASPMGGAKAAAEANK